MIEFTRHDAAYGVMMMGYAEDTFAQLRHVLTEASARAQEQRNKATADLLGGLARMRMTFLLLVSVGVGVSITAALLIARAISGPTVRLTRTMAALAGGSVEVEIPDRQRRDELGPWPMRWKSSSRTWSKGAGSRAKSSISPIMTH